MPDAVRRSEWGSDTILRQALAGDSAVPCLSIWAEASRSGMESRSGSELVLVLKLGSESVEEPTG